MFTHIRHLQNVFMYIKSNEGLCDLDQRLTDI